MLVKDHFKVDRVMSARFISSATFLQSIPIMLNYRNGSTETCHNSLMYLTLRAVMTINIHSRRQH
jgi:hypothetical protein